MYIGDIGGGLLLYRTAVRGVCGVHRSAGADTSVLFNAGGGGNKADGCVYGNMRGAAEKFRSIKTVGLVLVLLSF